MYHIKDNDMTYINNIQLQQALLKPYHNLTKHVST